MISIGINFQKNRPMTASQSLSKSIFKTANNQRESGIGYISKKSKALNTNFNSKFVNNLILPQSNYRVSMSR